MNQKIITFAHSIVPSKIFEYSEEKISSSENCNEDDEIVHLDNTKISLN